MVYVALLRGVNVGGKNKVDMRQLAAAFEAAGMEAVRTYINSGNILFRSSRRSVPRLTTLLERVIHDEFALEIKVLLLTIEDLRTVVGALPEDWVNGGTMKTDVLFLWEDQRDPAVVDDLPLKEGIDRLIYVHGALLWNVDRDQATRSGLSRVVGTELYRRMTVRNANTARKLLDLAEELERG
ncbi:MAG: DUF1697 domain-containing protein [Microthrixaceae bacterium]